MVSVLEEIPHWVAKARVKFQVWWKWHKPLFIMTAASKLWRQTRLRISWCFCSEDHVAARTLRSDIEVENINLVYHFPLGVKSTGWLVKALDWVKMGLDMKSRQLTQVEYVLPSSLENMSIRTDFIYLEYLMWICLSFD